MSSIGANGCMLMIVWVLWLYMTTPPWWREKVMVYYFKIYHLVSYLFRFWEAICHPTTRHPPYCDRPWRDRPGTVWHRQDCHLRHRNPAGTRYQRPWDASPHAFTHQGAGSADTKGDCNALFLSPAVQIQKVTVMPPFSHRQCRYKRWL